MSRRRHTRVRHHRRIDSTNRAAFDAAADGAPDGTVITADAQLAGRGRLGRSWESPAGRNLYLSILLRGPLSAATAAALPFVAAVAARDAVEAVTELPAQIKWPNDLVIDGRKIGGILIETKSAGDAILLAVVGIGINVNWPRRSMPAALQATASSLLIERGRSVSRTRLLAALVDEFDARFEELNRDGSRSILDAWSRHCATFQQFVRLQTAEGALTGRAEAIDRRGRLTLRHSDGTISRVAIDDTLRLRPVHPEPETDHAVRH